MSHAPHRIRKLRWMVSSGSLAEAFTLRQCLSGQWHGLLVSACEKVFDEIAGSDRTIHIPKLELHIKVNSEQELLDRLPELIQRQLQEQLRSLDLGTNSSSQSSAQPEVFWQQTTAQQNQLDILIHYLRTGSLPWQVSSASASDIAVNFKATCLQLRSQFINYLSNHAETTAFYFRLLQLLTRSPAIEIIDTLLDRISIEWKTAIIELIGFLLDTTQIQLNQPMRSQLVAAILSRVSSEQIPSNAFSESLDRILTEAGIDHQILVDSPSVSAALLQAQPNFDRAFTTNNPPALENLEIISVDDQALRSPLIPELDNLELDNLELDNPEFDNPEFDNPELDNPELDNPEFHLDSTNLFEHRSELTAREAELSAPVENPAVNLAVNFAEQQDGFSLFVNYAGLILIHPFISPLFEATGIKETNSNAIADAQMPRAAALLHFLATGQEEIYEYELGFIKILLGLEPETPLFVGAGLLQNCDREEAETLLQSAISYWTILGDISTGGLQVSFLQRSGLLRKTEDYWNLNVEHQSFDMLLAHLPWTISIVKLSWMKYPLYTEWQTF